MCLFMMAPACSLAAEQAPGLTVTLSEQLSYDDNLFRLSDAVRASGLFLVPGTSVDDLVNQASLGLAARLEPGQQALNLEARLVDSRYADNDSLNNIGGSARANWDWRIGGTLSGQLGAQYARALAGFTNTSFYGRDDLTTTAYTGSLRYVIGPHWRLMGGVRRADSSHSADARQGDDYASTSGTAGLEFETGSGNVVGADYQRAKGEFDRLTTLNGLPFDRDYDEDKASLRTRYAFTDKTLLQASAGYLWRHYPNSGIAEFSGGVWRASLAWEPSVKTRLDFAAWRELTADVNSESDYFVTRGASINPTWSPTVKLSFALQGSWEKQRYTGSTPLTTAGRRDEIKALSLSLRFAPRETFLVALTGRTEKRDSNRLLRGYDTDQLSLELRWSH
jgi:exopolysaccharide biosynthesis operon protein EpsL